MAVTLIYVYAAGLGFMAIFLQATSDFLVANTGPTTLEADEKRAQPKSVKRGRSKTLIRVSNEDCE